SKGGHIFVRVSVNGSEPLWFGLDSGAEATMIRAQQAERLKLKRRGSGQVAGGGEETANISFARNVRFNLAGANFVLKEVGVLPLEISLPETDEQAAGILGYDFFSRFVVEIDYEAHVINLRKPRGYLYRGRGEIIPVKMLDNNPFIPLRVELPGLAPFSAMFVIDSGADTDLFFFSPFVKKQQLLTSKQEMRAATSSGIGGASRIRVGAATSVQIGSVVIPNLVAHFSQAERGDDASETGAGFIGGKLLRRFKRVIFDQPRRRIIFEQ
ncbi:MAG: aspartyl protease family protein, partial [Acidobacteria bacterium]|nr:aspartyl protease family protein [Acidobacteriota bacterium]